VDKVDREVKSFLSKIPNSRNLIGLHVRHGNGGDIMGHSSSWTSFELAMKRIVKAVEACRQKLGDGTPVLLCTDSLEVVEVVRTRIDNIVYRFKKMRPRGSGELHHSVENPDGYIDALTDMILLSKCNLLIRYPAGSFFSFYAAIMKQNQNSNYSTVYELQQPWNKDDNLSPAIV
jgi:hypothetical protein